MRLPERPREWVIRGSAQGRVIRNAWSEGTERRDSNSTSVARVGWAETGCRTCFSRGPPSTDVYICQELPPLRSGVGPAGWGGDWDMGTVWRLCEYKGVNEGNILPSTPLTHTTTPHTFRDPRRRGLQERLNVVNSE